MFKRWKRFAESHLIVALVIFIAGFPLHLSTFVFTIVVLRIDPLVAFAISLPLFIFTGATGLMAARESDRRDYEQSLQERARAISTGLVNH